MLIPKSVKEGEHTLTVMGSNKDRVGSIDVFVLAPKELDVELEKKKVRINGTQTVTVSGLVAGETVTVTLDGEDLVEGVADKQGDFDYTFPVGSEPGRPHRRGDRWRAGPDRRGDLRGDSAPWHRAVGGRTLRA